MGDRDIRLTRDETLTLVYEKLMTIRAEADECDGYGRQVEELSTRSETARVKVKDFPAELKRRVKRIGQEAARACKIIETYESATASELPAIDSTGEKETNG